MTLALVPSKALRGSLRPQQLPVLDFLAPGVTAWRPVLKKAYTVTPVPNGSPFSDPPPANPRPTSPSKPLTPEQRNFLDSAVGSFSPVTQTPPNPPPMALTNLPPSFASTKPANSPQS